MAWAFGAATASGGTRCACCAHCILVNPRQFLRLPGLCGKIATRDTKGAKESATAAVQPDEAQSPMTKRDGSYC